MKNALVYYDNKLITVVKKFDSEGLWRQIHLFAKSGKSAVSQVKKPRAFHDKLGRFDLNQAPSSFRAKNDLADRGILLNVVLKLLDVFTSGFDREVRQTHFYSFPIGATTFSMTTLSIMTFSIMVVFVTLSIKDSQHNDAWHKHKLSFC